MPRRRFAHTLRDAVHERVHVRVHVPHHAARERSAQGDRRKEQTTGG